MSNLGEFILKLNNLEDLMLILTKHAVLVFLLCKCFELFFDF